MIDPPPRPYWMDHAPCQRRPELFYPECRDITTAAAAKLICKNCRYKSPCVMYAINRRETEGIWGGMGLNSRRRLASQLTREGLLQRSDDDRYSTVGRRSGSPPDEPAET